MAVQVEAKQLRWVEKPELKRPVEAWRVTLSLGYIAHSGKNQNQPNVCWLFGPFRMGKKPKHPINNYEETSTFLLHILRENGLATDKTILEHTQTLH